MERIKTQKENIIKGNNLTLIMQTSNSTPNIKKMEVNNKKKWKKKSEWTEVIDFILSQRLKKKTSDTLKKNCTWLLKKKKKEL